MILELKVPNSDQSIELASKLIDGKVVANSDIVEISETGVEVDVDASKLRTSTAKSILNNYGVKSFSEDVLDSVKTQRESIDIEEIFDESKSITSALDNAGDITNNLNEQQFTETMKLKRKVRGKSSRSFSEVENLSPSTKPEAIEATQEQELAEQAEISGGGLSDVTGKHPEEATKVISQFARRKRIFAEINGEDKLDEVVDSIKDLMEEYSDVEEKILEFVEETYVSEDEDEDCGDEDCDPKDLLFADVDEDEDEEEQDNKPNTQVEEAEEGNENREESSEEIEDLVFDDVEEEEDSNEIEDLAFSDVEEEEEESDDVADLAFDESEVREAEESDDEVEVDQFSSKGTRAQFSTQKAHKIFSSGLGEDSVASVRQQELNAMLKYQKKY